MACIRARLLHPGKRLGRQLVQPTHEPPRAGQRELGYNRIRERPLGGVVTHHMRRPDGVRSVLPLAHR
eukprot:7390148-Prymnesium_polylepis.3